MNNEHRIANLQLAIRDGMQARLEFDPWSPAAVYIRRHIRKRVRQLKDLYESETNRMIGEMITMFRKYMEHDRGR